MSHACPIDDASMKIRFPRLIRRDGRPSIAATKIRGNSARRKNCRLPSPRYQHALTMDDLSDIER